MSEDNHNQNKSGQLQSHNDNRPIKVDQNTCIGCGVCSAICGEVFEMKENGKADVRKDADMQCPTAKDAESSCPVNAISIEDK